MTTPYFATAYQTVPFYCPSCGQHTRAGLEEEVAPLAAPFRCQNCNTLWRVDFTEAGEEEEDP